MVTYLNIIVSLRKYFEDVLGITTVWRYAGYSAPEDSQYIGIEFVNSVYNHPTKLKELISEDIYLNIAQYAEDVVQLALLQAKVKQILLYHIIPLYADDGESIIGSYSISRVTGDMVLSDGTELDEIKHRIKAYTDVKVEIDHIKKR